MAALAACLVLAAGCKGPWGWGQNNFGQVGDGTTSTRTAPVEIDPGYTVVAAGSKHTVGVRTNGTLWAWGENGSRQLGDGTHDRPPRSPAGGHGHELEDRQRRLRPHRRAAHRRFAVGMGFQHGGPAG